MESMRHNILLSEIKQIKNLVKTIQMEGCIQAEQAVDSGCHYKWSQQGALLIKRCNFIF